MAMMIEPIVTWFEFFRICVNIRCTKSAHRLANEAVAEVFSLVTKPLQNHYEHAKAMFKLFVKVYSKGEAR